MTRTLRLAKDTLAELDTDELGRVGGGRDLSGVSCPLRDCLASWHPDCMYTLWC